jgi:uncharacterized protein YdaU (DUF1376 family)
VRLDEFPLAAAGTPRPSFVSSLSPSSSHLPSLELLLEPGSLDGLSAIELGAVVRILRLAWHRVPGCCVPADERSLAAVARVTSAEWLGMQAQLFACMRAVPAESGPGLLSCEIARMHYHGLVHAQAAAQEQRRRAGQASAAARLQRSVTPSPTPAPSPASRPEADPTGVQRAFNGRSTGVQRALEIGPGGAGTRFGGDTAHFVSSALERSDLHVNQERSSAEEPVIAAIHAGIDATAQARLTEWRRAMSRQLLEQAAKRWATEGRLGNHAWRGVDAGFIVRIAGSPLALPALVAIAIGRADEANAPSSLGYVASALGLVRGRGSKLKSNCGKQLTPYLGDQAVLDHWARLEEAQVRAQRVKAAARAAVGNVLARVGPVPVTDVDALRQRVAGQMDVLRRRSAEQKGA